MPKIKLSALASDIKGKSQGSVFSTNSGGTYFRNNPSGGGRQTQRLKTQQNKFGSLSTQWKSLTEAQQQAWKDAAPNYKTLNAFGDPRLPSGYELYMRLNSVLSSNNEPLLVTPLVPRSLPSIGLLDIDSPDAFQFVPNFTPNMRMERFALPALKSTDCFISADFSVPNLFNYRFGCVPGSVLFPTPGNSITLTYSEFSGNNGCSIVLYTDFPNKPYIVTSFSVRNDPSGHQTIRNVYALDESFNISDFSLQHIFSVDSNLFEALFLNGVALTRINTFIQSGAQPLYDFTLPNISVPADPTIPWDSLDGSWFIGVNSAQSHNKLNVSDVRYFDAAALDNMSNYLIGSFGPLEYLAYQYVTTFETAYIGFNDYSAGRFLNSASTSDQYNFYMISGSGCMDASDCDGCAGGCNDVECLNGVCTYVGDSEIVRSVSPFTSVPLVEIASPGIPEAGFAMEVLCSGSRSAGRDFNQVRSTKLTRIGVDSGVYYLSDDLKANYGGFNGSSAASFVVRVVDLTTGVVYNSDLPYANGKTGVRRFKAGAELSGKVN